MAALLVHRRVLIFAVVLSWISLDPAWGATTPLTSGANGPAKQVTPWAKQPFNLSFFS